MLFVCIGQFYKKKCALLVVFISLVYLVISVLS